MAAMRRDAALAREFAEQPLAFVEDEDEERERLLQLKEDDPIALQDVVNTSRALVDAAKAIDLEELRSVVSNAQPGELLQSHVAQAVFHALQATSLDLLQQLISWGVPLRQERLLHSLHFVCEITSRDNFSDTWRILQLLTEGNENGGISINTPRLQDGWTPLCVACSNACLPLTFKLLEMRADPNIITRSNETPLALVKKQHDNDSEEQMESRGIIFNMLRHHGAMESWKEVLTMTRTSAVAQQAAAKTAAIAQGATHTRWAI